MTDLDTIYRCNKWQLDAILEGLMLKQLDEQDALAELALNIRYTMNSKKVNPRKLTKDKQRRQIKEAFHKNEDDGRSQSDIAKKIQELNNHFLNR